MRKTIFTEQHKYMVKQLKKARREANLSQIEVANLIEKPQSYVSKTEAGQHRIDVIQLQEFARIYKKRLDYFIKKL